MGFVSGALPSPGHVELIVSDRSCAASCRAVERASKLCDRLGARLSVLDARDPLPPEHRGSVVLTPMLIVRRRTETRRLFGDLEDNERILGLLFEESP